MRDQAGAREAVAKALLIHPALTASEFFHYETYQDREQTSNLNDLLLTAGLPQ